jgi:hypothetical protein
MTLECSLNINESILNDLNKYVDLGCSRDASIIAESIRNALAEIHDSKVIGSYYQNWEKAINNAVSQSLEDNWDGFGAKAVDINSYENAVRFCRMLPITIPIPEIYVDNNGMLEFEWYKEPRKIMSVTVKNDNKLVFAGLFGRENKAYGTEELGQKLPKTIFDYLQRVFVS